MYPVTENQNHNKYAYRKIEIVITDFMCSTIIIIIIIILPIIVITLPIVITIEFPKILLIIKSLPIIEMVMSIVIGMIIMIISL